MGWCYAADAGRTLERVEAACRATRGEGETSSNVFRANGKRYFYQVTHRSQADGGICGTVWLTWEDEDGEWARQVSSFRIDGRGRVVRGPKLFKDAGGKP
jgi:hypothetical protein